jgi:uncharacterized membrane protein
MERLSGDPRVRFAPAVDPIFALSFSGNLPIFRDGECRPLCVCQPFWSFISLKKLQYFRRVILCVRTLIWQLKLTYMSTYDLMHIAYGCSSKYNKTAGEIWRELTSFAACSGECSCRPSAVAVAITTIKLCTVLTSIHIHHQR